MNAVRPLLQQLPWWLTVALVIAAVAVTIVVSAALCRASIVLLRLALSTACTAALHLANGIVSAAVLVSRALVRGLGLALWLLTRPLAHGCDWVRDAIIEGTLALRARIKQERELRRVWREEYRHLYPTWREFIYAFEHSEGASREDGNPFAPYRDAYEHACLVLGLPINAAFTQGQLNTRYRILMAKAHPDAGGTHLQASELNRARETIRKQRGWQS